MLASLGAGIVSVVVVFGSAGAALFAGGFTAQATRRNWLGWVAGLLMFVLLSAAFSPTLEALKRVECKGADDYKACIDGD